MPPCPASAPLHRVGDVDRIDYDDQSIQLIMYPCQGVGENIKVMFYSCSIWYNVGVEVGGVEVGLGDLEVIAHHVEVVWPRIIWRV